jgi:hypothetical protein
MNTQLALADLGPGRVAAAFAVASAHQEGGS